MFLDRVRRDWRRNAGLYVLVLPVLAFYVLFHYYPLYGAQIAFKQFIPTLGIWRSEWIGLAHFRDFFGSYYFLRILQNTLIISLTSLLFGFPAPILFALMLNELRNRPFKRAVQTITYMPHFISLVVICGIIREFTRDDGAITSFLGVVGFARTSMLSVPELFVPIYVASGIWQELGWGSIIYLAALSGIDPELYEASVMDGAGRFRQLWSITLPGILPTVMTLLILRMGRMLNVGYEKIILLYSPAIYETADVISSFVYRKGLIDLNFSYSSAVGLFNGVANLTLLVAANRASRALGTTSLW
jgi:putative aldouronate transport system permease protein